METYTIDLDTILQILGGYQQNGTLHGDIPPRKLDNKVPLKAQLRLFEGEVISCTILDERGTVISTGKVALEALRRAGQLNWTMMQGAEQSFLSVEQDHFTGASNPQLPTVQTSPRLSAVPTNPRLPIAPNWKAYPQLAVPQRLVTVTTEQMRQGQWSRNHRMVYGMIDGVRTIEKIAELLSLRPEEVEQIARDLQTIRVVALEY
ncbi:MAG TPA: hypothetical protein VGU68_19175 [Ktedonobacteraceae bacterium]|nr:hypothetical protein [Ktedonobacteraceae bacterium]